MNIINSLPNGSQYDPFKLNLQNEVTLVRQLYISTTPFENATIMRGSLQPMRVQFRHTTGVLLLWRKRDNTKIHLILFPEVDITNNIQQHYSATFFWNSDNSAPRYTHPDPTQQIQHPPGLDPPDEAMPHDNADTPDVNMPNQPDPHDPDYGTPGHPPFDDPPQSPPHHPTFDTPLSPEFHSPHPPDPPDEDMRFHSPQPEPQPIFPPGGNLIPVGSNDLVQPHTHIPNVIVPPNIPDEQKQHAQKRLPASLPWPPASKAKMTPATQMPPRSSQPSNRLGGEVVAKIPSQVASQKPKLPKNEDLLQILDSDDERDPNATSSGRQQPLLPYENAENDPLDIPLPQEQEQQPAEGQAQESEEEESDETIP